MELKLKDLRLQLKGFRIRRFLIRDGGNKRESARAKKPPWMMPISHGYHVVEDHSFRGGSDDSDSDSVVVQREQIQKLEAWFFGVFDARVGDGVTKYVQSHLFDRNSKESQIRKKSRDTMRKAYLGAREKIKEMQKSEDETWRVGSASVMVINGEKLVTANMGDYRALVCRDGVAHQVTSKHHQSAKRPWSRRLFSIRILAWNSSKAAETKHSQGSELVMGAERINSDTEFIIVTDTGIWEVIKNQEAVNLIRHIEDPQAAAECLAKEALIRMSKSNISCIIIRFDQIIRLLFS